MQTGLICEFSVSRSSKPERMDLEAFKAEVAKATIESPESYDSKEVGGMVYWTIRRVAREAHLVDLLNRYGADFYGSESREFDKYCKLAIDYLATNPSDPDLAAWIENSEWLTQLVRWSRIVMVGGARMTVHFSMWSLSSEGKVMVEELKQHLSFFEKAIRGRYADNPLGGSLAVDIG